MSASQGDLGDRRGPGGAPPPAGFLAWWRRRSAARRANLEARHLLKEARRILKKRGPQIPGAVTATVNAAIKGVTDAMEAGDVERLRKANLTLDETMDDHLSFARKSTIREYAESIGVAIAVALLLRAFVVEAFQIPSGSMIPTLEVGDHIFVSKFSYGLSIPFTDLKVLEYAQPKRGDVIVFKFPQDTSTDYIKRVVGLPGDTIEVRQGQLYVNGNEIHRERIPLRCHYTEPNDGVPDHDCEHWIETLGDRVHDTILEPSHQAIDHPRTVVPPNAVFVMGDNRDNSYDSRRWGTVDMKLIKGRALIIWWSRGSSKPWDPVDWVRAIRWKRFFTVVK
ncbi:MAG TPA: signal peptidase I [Polyangia bacterium]|nr:signal peptidase I [Polyangia bacterium]